MEIVGQIYSLFIDNESKYNYEDVHKLGGILARIVSPSRVSKGIYKTPGGKFRVLCRTNRKSKYLGTYKTLKEATDIYNKKIRIA